MSDAAAPDGPLVTLVEPARQRLVSIAADVLGRLGADEVPAALRPVARFTPSRRARLGATLLAAALDADPDFRARVADVVATASPQLADAVAAGAPTSASDPVDSVVVAYLLRPIGWERLVAQGNAQWSSQRQATGVEAAQAELARLRDQVAQLRAQLRAESARRKDARAEAAAQAEAELAEARRQVRARTIEVKAARDEAALARAELAEAQLRLDAAAAGREAEGRRARGRQAELERALEAARRSVRTDRDVDDARLWLLVDTLTQAAAGIRRELSLPAPARRPADTVGASARDSQRRSADDPAGLDRLLALPNVHLIVDGYNVTKTGYGELALADQRTRLLGALAALTGRSGAEITVAFDGGQRPPALPVTPRGVRVLFSEPAEIADDLIRRLVAVEPEGRPVVVVSSDHAVQRDIQRAGAWSVPSAVLLAALSRS